MKLGFIGLGKMGQPMVERLLGAGHTVVVGNRSPEPVQEMVKKGAVGSTDAADVVRQLESPRVVVIMVPHGSPVDAVLEQITPELSAGDVVVDAGNSHYTNSISRGDALEKLGVSYIDMGTSGGLTGALNGACLMIGGDEAVIKLATPFFEALAMPGGWAHVGPRGAGHYVKMVHNGVEYAMVQAYGEGFEMLVNSPYDYNLEQVADNWNHGSVVRSWVLELAQQAFAADPKLEKISDEVGGGSTGEWTLQASIDSKTSIPTIYTALSQRYATRRPESFASKVIAALRNQWGGHEVKEK
ncbi:MAG: 6-phosphogluconate dehydrogenase (decarboxylating) [Candidatus Kerfeldbacteria bacterium CG15_BIG_FIL_POST_REV_8_21_14_020_45_12]|uniref:6-phosphogluconate dehydrogenase (Decarboxylating) n=1 Tax=Candidatus Kerfeldbacteria bacterium CG15_BIG_FIL_POST_REV_8_21_14_020_45_12 TaxID=2014247 RepID=A0A2M7H2Z7_9BACT|nr:MAG: 6-phosphogluconate dehydrogenase (decarboxylating) [Candidatus Kerfeldbacteria bacterium CG15_BIG_FIL_POST_REV_8_21_14_020_45_12]PJA93395.1 MAG: 6-phosphogluconate dehydrogenase (decarboxylating) [Candidatus Kerfeldbacteria bacterium CG_4_9_14_3_um_filter_45_8]